MRNATNVTVATFGALAGLAGLEHGIGETLQGNRAPDGIMIVSWPGSAFFRIVAGEPAMTIVPNLLVTGILAILVSLGDLVCDASEDAMEVGRIQDDDAVGHKKTESTAAGGQFGHENFVWLHAVLGELAGSP